MVVSKVPPHSDDAESSVLGSILLDKDAIVQVSEFLRPEHFYAQKHGDIYDGMLTLFELREPIDLVTLPQKLKEQKKLKNVGGVSYLSSLVEGVPSSANIKNYGEIIRDYYTRRKLISGSSQIVEMSFDEGEEIGQVLDKAEQRIFNLSQKHVKQGFVHLKSVLSDSFDRLDELTKNAGSLRGVETGFADLDKTLAGLQDSNLLILAARPGTGKCVTGDTWMVDPETGARSRIDEMVGRKNGDVMSMNAEGKMERRTPKVYLDDGVKPVWEVMTKLGNKIEATSVHPLLTMKGWVQVKDLEIGERIGVPRVMDVWGNKEWEDNKLIALGYFLGDGGLTNRTARFTNSSLKVREDFTRAIANFPGVEVKNEKSGKRTQTLVVKKSKEWKSEMREIFSSNLQRYLERIEITQAKFAEQMGVSVASVSHWVNGGKMPSGVMLEQVSEAMDDTSITDPHVNQVTEWLRELGLMGKSSLEKSIPDEIFELKKEQVALFLNRLYASDGSMVVRSSEQVLVSYASSSYKLAEQVKHLLLRFGIIAKLRKKKIRYGGGIKIAYEVEVMGAGDILSFIDEIGIFGKEEKVEEARKIVSEKSAVRNWTKDTLPMEIWEIIKSEMGVMSWRELAIKMGKPESHNFHVGKRQLRRDSVLGMAKALKSDKLRQYAESDIFWDTIVSIEARGEKNVYDLSVPELHNFVANDIVVHNTAFAVNIAQYASVIKKVPIGFFSLEMSKEELVDRMLVGQADIDAWRLKTGKLSSTDFEKLSEAMGVLAEAPMFIDDTPGLSILEMRTKARRLKSEHNLGLIIVDYLQLMRGRSQENRVQEVGEISQGLKNLARELKVPVLALAQLSRAVEHRGGNQPQLSDLRESGSIEQDADVVMFLYREDDEDISNMKLSIAKHRNGAVRTIDLRFRGDRVRFYGLEHGR